MTSTTYDFSSAEHRVMKLIALIVCASLFVASLFFDPSRLSASPSPLTSTTTCSGSHTIVRGDTLWDISRANGVSMNSIVLCNGWTDGINHLLLPGRSIVIPRSTVAQATVAVAIATPAVVVPAGAYTHPNPNVERWHATALAAGWTEQEWRSISCVMQHPTWTNVAESSGLPHLHVARGSDNSYGLMMLNTKGSLWSWYQQQGLTYRDQLLDPFTNLRIAKVLSNYTSTARWAKYDKWFPWRSTSKRNTCF